MEPPSSRQQLRYNDQAQRRGPRASFYDYSRQMLSRGLGRRPTINNNTVAANRALDRFQMNSSPSSIPPQSGALPNPLISISDSKAARRRWCCCISVGFIISVTINIGSTLFVMHRLRAMGVRNRNSADEFLMEQFQGQQV